MGDIKVTANGREWMASVEDGDYQCKVVTGSVKVDLAEEAQKQQQQAEADRLRFAKFSVSAAHQNYNNELLHAAAKTTGGKDIDYAQQTGKMSPVEAASRRQGLANFYANHTDRLPRDQRSKIAEAHFDLWASEDHLHKLESVNQDLLKSVNRALYLPQSYFSAVRFANRPVKRVNCHVVKSTASDGLASARVESHAKSAKSQMDHDLKLISEPLRKLRGFSYYSLAYTGLRKDWASRLSVRADAGAIEMRLSPSQVAKLGATGDVVMSGAIATDGKGQRIVRQLTVQVTVDGQSREYTVSQGTRGADHLFGVANALLKRVDLKPITFDGEALRAMARDVRADTKTAHVFDQPKVASEK